MQERLDSIKIPDWSDAEARLIAFASPCVWEAVEANRIADIEADRLWGRYQSQCEDSRQASLAGSTGPGGRPLIEARKAAVAAVETAAAKSDELIVKIREDLHSEPSQTASAELPTLGQLAPPAITRQ